MDDFLLFSFVVILAFLFSFPVKALLDFSTSKCSFPDKPSEIEWSILKSPPGTRSGSCLGILEQLLSALVFYSGAFYFLGGWLVLKLGSKWQTWASIANAPQKCEDFSTMEWFVARRTLASWLSQRFLIGTLANVLSGWLILALAKQLIEFIHYITWVSATHS